MFEPISTISNLAFIIFGFVVFKRSKYVGVVTISLGIASGGWHWAMQPFWHTFDLGMIYFMLLSLVNFAAGSKYTLPAFLASIGMIGMHFILPSNLIISVIAFSLLFALIRHYPVSRILIIVGCFALWISTNIPYLHEWNLPFWSRDALHGISHFFAAIGIYKVISYKPTTFFELTNAFKTIRLPSLNEATRTEFEQVIDLELNPVLGDQVVDGIKQQDISQLVNDISNNRENMTMADGVRTKLHQIFEFASGRGIKHNLAAEVAINTDRKNSMAAA
ncbi:MAG: hypothetical protein WD059_12485 [Balneolaceae bacterium]